MIDDKLKATLVEFVKNTCEDSLDVGDIFNKLEEYEIEIDEKISDEVVRFLNSYVSLMRAHILLL